MGPDTSSEKNLADQQSTASQDYFNASFPGFQQSEDHYRKLASGAPEQVNAAIAPQANQIIQQYEGLRQRAKQTQARGGAEGDVTGAIGNAQASQLAGMKANAVNQAYQALAQLGVQGGNLSAMDAYNAMNAFGQVNQAEAESKASTMGLIGGFGGDLTTLGAAGKLGGLSKLFGGGA